MQHDDPNRPTIPPYARSYEDPSGKFWSLETDSLDDFYRLAENSPRRGSDRAVIDNIDERFYGPTLPETLSLGRDGWTEGAEKALGMFRTVLHGVRQSIGMDTYRETWEYDVTGQALDVARYCDNEPEHWSSMTQAPTAVGRLQVIQVNTGMSAAVGNAFLKGAAVLAAVDTLQRLGIPTEVRICDDTAAPRGADRIGIRVNVLALRASEVPDFPRLAFALAHNGFARRLVIGIQDQPAYFPEYVRQSCDIGFGRSNGCVGDFGPIGPDVIKINGLEWGEAHDQEGAERLAREILIKAGIELEG